MLAPPLSPRCQHYFDTLLQECKGLGVPIAAHETEGPSTCLVFLGIEVDTITGKLRLPRDKLLRLQTLLQQWGDRKVSTCRELESLVGLLNHASKVIRAGRSFLRMMIDLLHSGPYVARARGNTPIRLNAEFRANLAWWQAFVADCNGTSFLPTPAHLPRGQVVSDASGCTPICPVTAILLSFLSPR